MRTLLTEFRANFVWPWVSGAFTLLIGLVVVALHQHWRGAPAIIVSAVGWLTTLKGFFLMAFPQTYLGFASNAIDAAEPRRRICRGPPDQIPTPKPASSSARHCSVSVTKVAISGTTSRPAT